jgi:hypothetical protein
VPVDNRRAGCLIGDADQREVNIVAPRHRGSIERNQVEGISTADLDLILLEFAQTVEDSWVAVRAPK